MKNLYPFRTYDQSIYSYIQYTVSVCLTLFFSCVLCSETIDDILASVEFDRSSSKQTKNLNSFEMFLALLGIV